MNIFIPIEVKSRELESRSLLAFEAASRGHKVILGGKEDTIRLAAKGCVNRGLVFDKSITDNQIPILKKIKENGFILTCQDEEHGLLDINYAEFAKLRFSETTLELCDQLFAWGNHDYESIIKIYPKFKNKVIASGSPRVDLWRKEFDSIYKSKQIPVDKPFILVVSNFGRVFNSFRIWDLFEIRKRFLNIRSIDVKEYFSGISYETNLVGEFVTMIGELARNYPSFDIVVRPHPVEDEESWKKFLSGLGDNIKVEKDGGISKWIRNAELIVHNGCTSSMEASVSGIPVFTFRPIPSNFERETPNLFGYESFSKEELISQISSYLMGSIDLLSFKRNFDLIESRFANLDNQYAFERIVDEWEQIGSSINLKNANVFTTSAEAFKHKLRTKRLFVKVYMHLKTIIKNDKQLLNNSWHLNIHKFPSLIVGEVESMKHEFASLKPSFKSVKLKQFGERSILFHQ